MKALRYRTGADVDTFQPLQGWPHVAQSLRIIWLTRLDTRVMRLDFGSSLFDLLAEDITPELALRLYDALISAAHEWEPEYRIDTMQLVSLERHGGLGVRHSGIYYPEGRFGIYDYAEEVTAKTPIELLRGVAA